MKWAMCRTPRSARIPSLKYGEGSWQSFSFADGNHVSEDNLSRDVFGSPRSQFFFSARSKIFSGSRCQFQFFFTGTGSHASGSPFLNSSSVHAQRSFLIPGASSSSSSQAPVLTRHELHFLFSDNSKSSCNIFKQHKASSVQIRDSTFEQDESPNNPRITQTQQFRLQNSKPKTHPTSKGRNPRLDLRAGRKSVRLEERKP